MSKYYTELEKLLGVQTLTDNERTALAYGHRKGREDAQPQKIKDLIADRNEWKQQHENLLSVRQSDLQVIAKLEERIRVADAEEPVGASTSGGEARIYSGIPLPRLGSKLYLHAQIPAEVELKAKIAELEAIIKERYSLWLIYFDDQDRRPEIFTDEGAALKRYEDISISWNAHLFVLVNSNSRDAEKYPPVIKEQP